ncbi:MAG: RluA family pseudouridine synthase [Pseudomonadota bacterium]|nr:RluA family pseudouridine synthase [Pseudomonadota bacterium]
MTGVQTRTVTNDENGMRLDRWLRQYVPQVTQGWIQKNARKGSVRIGGARAKADTRLAAGQAVRIPPVPEAKAPAPKSYRPPDPELVAEIESRILYRDADLLIIDKPYGLAVQGGSGTTRHLDAVLDAFKTKKGGERPRLVHRLDRDTSGVLVLAASAFAARELGGLFKGRDVEKLYLAVTVGVPDPSAGTIKLPLTKGGPKGSEKMRPDPENGQPAITDFDVLEKAAASAGFVALVPRTGRTHQLRAHMAAVGSPILGDGKYGGKEALPDLPDIPKQLHLYACRIRFSHPRTGKMVDVTAPLPAHMRPALDFFGFDERTKSDFLD